MEYKVISLPQEMKNFRHSLKGTIAVVPTMGALHKGHLSLVEEAKRRADTVVMTIFVNPTQFGPNDDLDKYPRDLESDLEKGSDVGVDCFFTPQVGDMYPDNFGTFVVPESQLVNLLEGASRPGHFRGVTTIVLKIFNIIQPDVAIFGLKDYQQYKIIHKMVCDLDHPVEVLGVPTYREEDGLAMSSRNAYLSGEERSRALGIFRALQQAKELLLEKGETNLSNLEKTLEKTIVTGQDVVIDYVKFVNPNTLEDESEFTGSVLLAVAAKVGKTRLIDNILISARSR